MLLIIAEYRFNKPFSMANATTYMVGVIILYIRFDTERELYSVISNYMNLLLFNAFFIIANGVYLVYKLIKNRAVG
jgi:hypothetical protein